MQCIDSEAYASITLTTPLSASGKLFSVISGNNKLYRSPSLENSQVHVYEVCLPVLRDGEYTLVLDCSEGSTWDDGDSIRIQNADGNLIFEKLMTTTKREEMTFSFNTPVIKEASVILSTHTKTVINSSEGEVPQDKLEVTFKRTYGSDYAHEESFLVYEGLIPVGDALLEMDGGDKDNNMVITSTTLLSRAIYTIVLEDIANDGWSENSILEVFVNGELFRTYRLEEGDLQVVLLDLSDSTEVPSTEAPSDLPQVYLDVTFRRVYGIENAEEESYRLFDRDPFTGQPILEEIGSEDDNSTTVTNTIRLLNSHYVIYLKDRYELSWVENSILEILVNGELFQTYRVESGQRNIVLLDLSGFTESPSMETPSAIPEITFSVTFKRKYGEYASEEAFKIFKGFIMNDELLEMVGGEDNIEVIETLQLEKTYYSLYLADSEEDGWSENSILDIFVNGEFFQSYRLASGSVEYITLDLTNLNQSTTTEAPTTIAPTTVVPTTQPPTTETPTTEIPTTEITTTEIPVILCPSTSNLPEGIPNTYFSTPCTHPYIGEMTWKCVEAEDHKHALWSYVEGDSCRAPSPDKGRVFYDFTLQLYAENTNWEKIKEIIRQAYEKMFKQYSFVEITIWRIFENSRRLQETTGNMKYGVRAEVMEEEALSVKKTLENTTQLLSEMRSINSEVISETTKITIDGEMSEKNTVEILEDDDFTCDQDGYIHYLNKWTENMKSTSRDENSIEFHTRLGYFIDNCELIHAWNRKKKYKLSFTFYSDWSEEEYEQITLSTQQYSGTKPLINEIGKSFNNTSWRHLMPSLDPCDDVYEDGSKNTLRSTISKPQKCSVSWAFATTTSIEYAIEQLYQREYGHAVKIALSAQELIDCVRIMNGMEGERTCEAMPLALAFEYIYTNGIAYRQFYHHTNTVGECKIIRDEEKYFISGYEKPISYNKFGLFEMIERGPVAVSMGLDVRQFQHYSGVDHDLENGWHYFNTAYWRPSIYGVIVEYKQYEGESMMDFDQSPYFVIESRLHACDELVYRVPITDEEENANFAGIAGYAIRPIVSEYVNIPIK